MLGLTDLRQAMGRRAPPTDVWQRPFDQDDSHLRRLARLQPDARADPMDLVDYALDLHYEQMQRDLLLWLLPFCLRAWRDDLRGEDKTNDRQWRCSCARPSCKKSTPGRPLLLGDARAALSLGTFCCQPTGILQCKA